MPTDTTAPRLISVIVPTRNRPALLREALESIRALESPAYRFEILVGDNGGLPETKEITESFGAIHIPVDRLGAGAGRNAGLEVATGEFITFLDDDDKWLPGHLTPHIAHLDANPEVDAVISQVISSTFEGELVGVPWPRHHPGGADDLLREMLSGYFPQIGTAVCRRRVRDYAGYFDEKLLGGQDLDWLLKVARGGRMEWLMVPSVMFRGRPLGTDDTVNLARVGYDRTVFFRHAVPEWRLWKTPLHFMKAYDGTLWHFYEYFTNVAQMRADNGDRDGVFKAVSSAFKVFPVRAAMHMVLPKPLQRSVLKALKS